MAHLSYNEFKDKFGNLGITEWVKYNWIGWSQDKTGEMLRRHLSDIAEIDYDDTAVVDLGALNWLRQNAYGKYEFFTFDISNIKNNTQNILCILYTIGIRNNLQNNQMSLSGGTFVIRNDEYTDTSQFKQAMSGVLLAYEKA